MNNPEQPLECMNTMDQEQVFVNRVETIRKILAIDPRCPDQTAKLQYFNPALYVR